MIGGERVKKKKKQKRKPPTKVFTVPISPLEGEEFRQYKDTSYWVSNYARVIVRNPFRRHRGTTIIFRYGDYEKKSMVRPNRYVTQQFTGKNKKKTMHLLHRLVAELFIPNPEGKPVVNHIDGNPSNNHVSNLEWVTYQENAIHAFNKLGINPTRTGSANHLSKLNEADVREIARLLKEENLSGKAIAKRYNVTHGTISSIKRGISWRKLGLFTPTETKSEKCFHARWGKNPDTINLVSEL